MRAIWIATLGLLLGSCESGTYTADDAFDLADAAQANARTALSQISEQESRLDDLESKIQELEERADEAARLQNENTSLLEQRWRAYQNHTHGYRG